MAAADLLGPGSPAEDLLQEPVEVEVALLASPAAEDQKQYVLVLVEDGLVWEHVFEVPDATMRALRQTVWCFGESLREIPSSKYGYPTLPA